MLLMKIDLLLCFGKLLLVTFRLLCKLLDSFLKLNGLELENVLLGLKFLLVLPELSELFLLKICDTAL